VARMVLVADDSPTHQRRASGILTGEGLEVVTVSNGVAAIKKLSTLKPALILADVSMPGRDGYEVCEFVKSSPDLARVPVLLIFSDLEPYDEARAQRVRADGRIKKPFGQDELVNTVNRFLPEAAEAAPAPPVPAAFAAPPEPAIVTEPVDEEPQVPTKVELPDLALSAGMAFGEQAIQEEAAPAFAPPPAMEQPPVSAPPVESGFGFPQAVEETPAPELVAPPQAEAPPEAQAPPEPVLEEEESAAAIPPPEAEPAERTMMFRTPVQIAEPMLSDELAPPPAAVTEPEPEAAPPPQAEAPAEAAPTAAWSLESYSLTEAGAGQVRFAAAEVEAAGAAPPLEAPQAPAEEAPAAAEAEAAAPTLETAAPPEVAPPAEPSAPTEAAAPEETVVPAEAAVQVVDTDLVYWIVHSVVVRMAPPALPTPMVEEMIRTLTDEIIAELTQPPAQS
jgi:CheY-like chemotaxis protein